MPKIQFKKKINTPKKSDPYVIRTHNLSLWRRTRYRCAKESPCLGMPISINLYVTQLNLTHNFPLITKYNAGFIQLK